MGTIVRKERQGGVIREPDNEWRPEYARWTDDRYPPRFQPDRGQGQLFNPNQTLPVATKAFTGAALLGLLYGIDHWARPLLRASKGKPSGGFLSLIFWTVQRVVTLLNPQVRYTAREVSKGAAHTSAAPAAVIGRFARRWEQLVWNVAYLYWELGLVLPRIVHVKIPQAVRKGIRPLQGRISRVEHGLRRERRQRLELRRWIVRQLTLRVYPQLRQLRRIVTQQLPARIRRLERGQARTNTRVRTHTSQLRRLRWLLPFAGAIPLFRYMLRRSGLNWLRCRNVSRLGKRLCSTDQSRLDDLLADLLGILGTVSLVEFIREGQRVEREAVEALRFFIRDV